MASLSGDHIEIYFEDLSDEAKNLINQTHGPEDENNWNVFPVAIIPIPDCEE